MGTSDRIPVVHHEGDGCAEGSHDMQPGDTLVDARFQQFQIGGSTVTACMWCGCFVLEPLHGGRCAGEGPHHKAEAIAQEMFEEAVTEGLYDDEETP